MKLEGIMTEIQEKEEELDNAEGKLFINIIIIINYY